MSFKLRLPLLGLLLLPLLLAACAPGGSNSSNAHTKNGNTVFSYADEKAAQFASDTFTLTCASAPCPLNVGVMMVKQGHEISTCTFSLVGEDVALSNRHCLPAEMAHEGQACPDVAFIFNENGQKQVVGCNSIIALPPEYQANKHVQRDFAFLRLKTKMKIQPLGLSTAGVQDQEILTAYTATPSSDNVHLSAVIDRKDCMADMNSILVPSFQSTTSPVLMLKGCTIVHGNSGSPLIGSDSQIKGVIQASYLNTSPARQRGAIVIPKTPDTSLPNIKGTTFAERMTQQITSSQVALATNTACMDAPSLGVNHINDNCDILSKTTDDVLDSKLYMKAENDQQLLTQVNALTAPINAQSPTIQWIASPKIRPPSAAENRDWTIARFDLIPQCIKAGATADQGIVTAPESTVFMDVDSSLHPITNVSSVSQSISFSTTLKSLKDDPNIKVTVLVRREQGATETYSIGQCH